MVTWSQKDPEWADLKLGDTDLTCYHFGCYVTAIAQLLTVGGYQTSPADVIAHLNQNGGFTKDGLAIHSRIVSAFPQLHYDPPGEFLLVQGTFPKLFHWVSKYQEGVYDPWTGGNAEPQGFKENGIVQHLRIDPPAPVNVPIGGSATVTSVSGVRIRTAPNLQSDIVTILRFGDAISFDEIIDGAEVEGNAKWIKLFVPITGTVGYSWTGAYHIN